MESIRVTDNQRKILSLVRLSDGISRTDIAKKLGLSLPSISKHIEKIIALGLVYEDGFSLSSGGRRPIVLRYNYNLASCLNIIVEANQISAYLTNLTDSILESDTISLQISSAECFKSSIRRILDLPKFADINTIVIALPGIIDETTIVKSNLYPELEGANLREYLEIPWTVRFVVANDVDCKVYGKYVQSDNAIESAYYISYETNGIGSGLIIHGEIYRGFHYYAGELGYLEIDNDTKIHDALFGDNNLEFEHLVQIFKSIVMSVMFTLDPQVIYLAGNNTNMNPNLYEAVIKALHAKHDFESCVLYCDKNHELQLRGMLEFTMNDIEMKL